MFFLPVSGFSLSIWLRSYFIAMMICVLPFHFAPKGTKCDQPSNEGEAGNRGQCLGFGGSEGI